MNERRAKEAGYTFTGIYSWNKEEVKKRATELRAKGNRVMVVHSPGSKYARGGSGGGWSAYWIESEANAQERKLQAASNRAAMARREVAKAIESLVDAQAKLTEAEAVLAELTSKA